MTNDKRLASIIRKVSAEVRVSNLNGYVEDVDFRIVDCVCEALERLATEIENQEDEIEQA